MSRLVRLVCVAGLVLGALHAHAAPWLETQERGVHIRRGGSMEDPNAPPAITFDESATPAPGMLSSGTGFFVSRDGDIITNAHVVHGCRRIWIKTAGRHDMAQLVAMRKSHDLALLRTRIIPYATAKLRYEGDPLHPGALVALYGFPKQTLLDNIPLFRVSKLVSPTGPSGESSWVQFERSADHGNSGGPLLDSAARVAGVVAGTFQETTTNRASGEVVATRSADLAVSPQMLSRFLRDHHVRFEESRDHTAQPEDAIRRISAAFIVQVVCGL